MPQLETARDYLQGKTRTFNDARDFFLEVDRHVLALETTGLIIPGEIRLSHFKITWEITDAYLVQVLHAEPYDPEQDNDEEDIDEVEEDDSEIGLEWSPEDDEDDDDDCENDRIVTYRMGLRLWTPERGEKTLATIYVEVQVEDYWLAWIQARKIEIALGWHPIIQENKTWPGTYLEVKSFDLTEKLTPKQMAGVVLEAAEGLREFCLND